MAQTPASATPGTTTQAASNDAQTLNNLEPGNTAQAQMAANLAHTDTAIASNAAPAAVKPVDMGLVQDTQGPNINPAALEASAKLQTREAQVQANPALLNVSNKMGAIGYTAMKFGRTEALNKPTAGQTVHVQADAGEQFKVNFDPNAAQLNVRNGDLVFSFNDGSRIVVDHFVMSSAKMPSLILPDGTILAGGVVVAQLTGHNTDDLFNIETAAGPGAGGVAGAGSFVYSDDLGDVIGMLDKLPPIPFTELAFPRPTDTPVPFIFPLDNTPGPQGSFVNVDDETLGFNNHVVTGQIVPDFGRDGAGAIALTSDFNATGSLAGGNLTSHGSPIKTSFSNGTITGTDGNGNVIFTVHVNPNGTYEFKLLGQLDHADKTNPDDVINLNFTYVVTDSDGDAANGSLQIQVHDDGPLALNDFQKLYNNDTVTGNVITGLNNEPVGSGIDQLSQDGTNEIVSIRLGNTFKSFDNPADVNPDGSMTFPGQWGTLTIHKDGSYSYTHQTNVGEMNETFIYTLRDYDGDTSEAQLVIKIFDGTPFVYPQGDLVGAKALDESNDIGHAIQGAITYYPAQYSPLTAMALGDAAHNAQFSVSGSVASGPALHSNGQEVHVALINGVYVGYTGNDPNAQGAKVFDLALTGGDPIKQPDGSYQAPYTFTQYQNLDHADASNPDDIIRLNFGVTATDADGDSATNTLYIDIRDDAPIAKPDVNHATRTIVNYDYSANAPDMPSLSEHSNIPFGDQANLYQMGADKASNINVTYPTTVTIERLTDAGAETINGSPVFAFTQKSDGTITNIQLVLSNGVADPAQQSGPDHATYTMTDAGKLGFFIVSNGTVALQGEGIIDANGNVKPGYSFGIAALPNDGYKVTYTDPQGQTHDLPYYNKPGEIGGPQTAARFAGYGFDNPSPENRGLVQGIAGRDGDYKTNEVRYGFEDGPLKNPGNDLDYNDVQFKVTVEPSSTTVNPIITGNVITGENGGGANAADHVGQDDLQPGLTNGTLVQAAGRQDSMTLLISGPVGGSIHQDGGGKYVLIEGNYGTLKMYENGNYSYNYNKPNPSNGGSDVFKYTIIDSDGDTATTTLTIGLDNNYVPSVSTVGASLNEADLPGPDSVTRDIIVTSPEAISSVTVTTAGLPNLQANGQPITYTTTDGKTLTATAGGQTIFTVVLGNPAQQQDGTYKVPYTFTLNHPVDQPTGDGTNITNLPIHVDVKDASGDVVSTTIPLQIIDDVPHANDDSLSLANAMSNGGNLLGNDVFGADGPANNQPAIDTVTKDGVTKSFANPEGSDNNVGFIVFTNAAGTLKVYENGNYTFTRPQGAMGELNQKFDYTIKDHDGDISTAHVTIGGNDNPVIIITPPPPQEPGTINPAAPPATIDEHTLTVPGTDSVTQTITFSAPDGLDTIKMISTGLPTLTVNGQTVTYVISNDGHSLTGSANGQTVLTVELGTPTGPTNGNYSLPYTFTLLQPLDNPGPNDNKTNIPVQFIVTDKDGDSAASTLPLRVVDDVPVANDDSLSMGRSPSVDGENLLKNDLFNADGPATNPATINNVTYAGTTKDFGTPSGSEGGVKFVSFDTPQGVLKVFENGEYNFTRPTNSFGEVNQAFTYTIKDHDGDTSSAIVTVRGYDNPVIITNPNPNDPNGNGAGVTVDEHQLLPLGQNTASGTNVINFTAVDGIGSFALKTDGLPSLTTANGQAVTFTLSPDGHTLYGTAGGATVLTVALQNPMQNPQDTSGNSYQITYQFTLVQALMDAGTGKNIKDIPVQFTVKDTDGDSASTVLALHVIDDVPQAYQDMLNLGQNLSGNGTNILSNDLFNADGPNGGVPGHVNSVSYAGVTKDFSAPTGIDNGVKFISFTAPEGTLKVFENGEYSYTRATATGSLNQTFSYTIKDSDGDVSETTVAIRGDIDNQVIIQSPAVDPSGAIIPEANLLVPGVDAVNNQIAFTAPDGVASVVLSTDGMPALTAHGQPVSYSVSPDGHTLTATANGQTVFTVVMGNAVQQPDHSYRAGYTFTLVQPLDNPGPGQNTTNIPVKFVVTDTDGDNATANLPLQVVDHTPSINSASREVDETSGVGQSDFNIVTGNLGLTYGADGPADSNPFTLTGLTIDGATAANQLSSGGVPVSIALVNNAYVGTANGQTVFSLSVDAQGNYAYHQYKPLDHNNTNDPNEVINFHVGYNVTDHDGDVASGSVTIAVHDDAPITNPDQNTVMVETRVFNVLGGAPDFPSLLEHKHVPEGDTAALYQQGADKASSVYIDHPTTISIDRIPLNEDTTISGSPVFAFTQKDDGTITNIKLIFGNGSTDNQYNDNPTNNTYTMTDTGKLGFFIIRGGTNGLEAIGAIDGHGVIQPGYSFGLAPAGNGVYKVTYTGPDGQTHDVPTYDYQHNFESPTAGAAFAGYGFDGTHQGDLVQGIAGRESSDPANVLRYGFEDGPLWWSDNDLDFNDVQFVVTVNPTYAQVSPPVSGNVLPNDKVGLDVMSGHAYNTMVTQVALGMAGAFVSVENAVASDSNGKYVDIQGEYGVLRMHDNGEYTYTLTATSTGGDLTDDFRYTIRDADGDTSNASTLTIHIVDNGQTNGAPAMHTMSLMADTSSDHSDTSGFALMSADNTTADHSQDAAMLKAAAGTATTDAPSDAPASPSDEVHHIVAGHVTNGEANHFALDTHTAENGLTSNGHAIETKIIDGVIHGSANGQDVYTLSLDDQGHYVFDLRGTIDQAQQGNTMLAFGYTAKDSDGSAVEGQLMIDVHGDHAAPVETGTALAIHDLISSAPDSGSAHGNIAINTVSHADILATILDDHDPKNGYGG